MFDNIVIFTQLVEIGSFSKTSEYLNIANSTLTRKIQDLESYFNKALLIRDTRNLKLTNDGEELYQKFKNLRSRLTSFYNNINPKEEYKSGELNVALPIIISLDLITPYLSYFNEIHPDIKLNLFFQHRNTEDMWNDKLDIAISITAPTSKKYAQRFVRSEYMQMYCTPEYARKYGLPLTVDQIQDHAIIGGIGKDDNILDYITFTNKHTNEHVIYDNKNAAIKVNNIAHSLKIGMSGNYIFPCLNYYCEKLVRRGELVQVLPEYHIYKVDFYIVSLKSIRPEAQIFIDFIYRCMNQTIAIDVMNAKQFKIEKSLRNNKIEKLLSQ